MISARTEQTVDGLGNTLHDGNIDFNFTLAKYLRAPSKRASPITRRRRGAGRSVDDADHAVLPNGKFVSGLFRLILVRSTAPNRRPGRRVGGAHRRCLRRGATVLQHRRSQ